MKEQGLYVIYVAAPYKHEDLVVQVNRVLEATKYAAALMDSGYAVFSPLSHSKVVELQRTYGGQDNWYDLDLHLLGACSSLHVLVLDGWTTSKGVMLEIAEAEKLGIPVKYIMPPTYETRYTELLTMNPDEILSRYGIMQGSDGATNDFC